MKDNSRHREDSARAREADLAVRRQHYLDVELPKLKSRVREEAGRRRLASFMNRTRWEALRKAVDEELPFPPPFQRQDIIGPREEPWGSDATDYWGDWSDEGLEPFFSIEWLRVVPRYRRHVARLLPPETIDCSDQFRDLLVRLRLPWREDERGFWVYGYAGADPATLTAPPEWLT